MKFEIINGKAKINETIIEIPTIEFTQVGQAGANGVLFFGYDNKLERKIAIKFWITQKNDFRPKKKQALLEAQKLAQLNDKHIVQIYTVGEVKDYFYAIEEYIDGITLKEWLEIKPEFARRIGIWEKIVRGMKVAHERKIYHGDLHEKNVLITQDEEVKIIDFGTSYFARSIEDSKTRDCKLLIKTAISLFPEYKQYDFILKNFYEIPEVVLAMLERWVKALWILKCLKKELYTSRHDYSIKSHCNSLALNVAIVPLFDIDKLINILSKMGLEKLYIEFFISHLSSFSEQIMYQKEKVFVLPLSLENLQSVKRLYNTWGETYLEKWEYYLEVTQ